MIKAAFNKRSQCIFTGMSTWTMTTVVTERNSFGECDIEAKWSSNRGCDLSDFDGMGESSALMVVGEDKDLGFAGKSAKGRRMQNSISISFKTGSQWVGFFGDGPIARFVRAGCETTQR
jgi:hypothetical protein